MKKLRILLSSRNSRRIDFKKTFASKVVVSQVKNRHTISYIYGESGRILSNFEQDISGKYLLELVVSKAQYTLLPFGYPASVSSSYRRFVIGQFFGTTLSSTAGVLSMQSLLFALGLGNDLLPAASAINWILKDGIGQFGGILFASTVNNNFDQNPKKWKLLASISLDCSSFIELLTPLVPGYFLAFASIANIGKNISCLSASASRVALHKSFALNENLADITAKSGSQAILASMTGTGIGIWVAYTCNGDMTYLIGSFLLCSAGHIASVYLSLKHVVVNTLSHGRLDCLLHEYLRSGRVLTPAEMCEHERWLSPSSPRLPTLNVGSDLGHVVFSAGELQVSIPSLLIFKLKLIVLIPNRSRFDILLPCSMSHSVL